MAYAREKHCPKSCSPLVAIFTCASVFRTTVFTMLEAISSPEPSDPQSCAIEKSSDVEYDP